MADLTADFSDLFADCGDDITIDDETVKALVAPPGVFQEPFFGDANDGGNYFIIVQKGDLADLDQWPLDDPEVVIDEITYRVIRDHESSGHVQLFLQEA